MEEQKKINKKFMIRFRTKEEIELHKKLKIFAAEQNKSMNAMILEFIKKEIGKN